MGSAESVLCLLVVSHGLRELFFCCHDERTVLLNRFPDGFSCYYDELPLIPFEGVCFHSIRESPTIVCLDQVLFLLVLIGELPFVNEYDRVPGGGDI